MVIKSYSVTLEEGYVSKAKEVIKPSGGKISPIINQLLKEWLDQVDKEIKEEEEEIEEEGENGNTR